VQVVDFALQPADHAFDLAVLWQAGFRNTTCAIGTHLTPLQFNQLSKHPDLLGLCPL
jgi:DNA primase